MIPLIGDLLLVRDHDLVSRAIEDVTRSPYSHVAVFVGANELIEAQGFRKVGYQDAGVYHGKADVFRCYPMNFNQREKVVESVKSRIGQHYDYLLIGVELVRYTLGVVLPWYEHDTVICSTLAADAYRAAGIEPCPNIAYPSPADLSKSRLFRKIGPW